MAGYDVAQICQNGHVINNSSIDFPHHNQKFCERCGSATITQCQECNAPIRGYYRGSMAVGFDVPSFCNNCGQPYPWTNSRLQAVHELAQELDILSDEDRNTLQKSIDDLVKDTPASTVATTKFKKIMDKIGRTTAGMFREILIDVLSEAAKKAIFPS